MTARSRRRAGLLGLFLGLALGGSGTANAAPGIFPGALFPTGAAPAAVALTDLNGDGEADSVAPNSVDDTMSVLLGNGDGTFQTQTTEATGAYPVAVAAGLLDGADEDVVVANYGEDTVSALIGNGDGTFQPQVAYDTGAGTAPTAVVLGDVNGDSSADIVTANDGNDTVSVLLGNGDGTFQAPLSTIVGTGPSSVAIANLDGGANADLVVSNAGADTVTILLGNGDGTFSTAGTPTVGTTPVSVAADDLDGNGALDVVTANDGSTDVSVLLGNGDGTFAPQSTYATANQPENVQIADLDGNGDPDVVTSNCGCGNNVSVLLGNGDGTLKPQVSYLTGIDPAGLAIGDVDGNGTPDLVTADYGNDAISVLLAPASGDGTFLSRGSYPLDPGAFVGAVTTTDLDSDHKADVIALDGSNSEVSVLLGNGDGSLQTAVAYPLSGGSPSAVATGDMNGDGKQDVVVPDPTANVVSVLLGNGDGTLQAPTSFALPQPPATIATSDVNDDGKPDLVVESPSSTGGCGCAGTISVLLGNGDGTFQASQDTVAGNGVSSMVVGDVNGDGKPDLALSNQADLTVSVLLGTGGGTFQPEQVTAPVRGVPSSLAIADLDGDGTLDLAVGDLQESSVHALTGAGDGTFTIAGSASVDQIPFGLTLADLTANNGDGTPDVISTGVFAASVSVLLNQTPSAPTSAGKALVSELRLGGPQGQGDQYAKVYNRSADTPLDVGGWALEGSNGQSSPIPYGTMIPPSSHLMLSGPPSAPQGFGLSTLGAATGQLPYGDSGALAIPQADGGVRLSGSTGASVDAVGFGTVGPVYRSGTALTDPGFGGQSTFARRFSAGQPVNTANNAADFLTLDTTGSPGSVLGAPRPDGLTAPTVHNDILQSGLIDPSVAASASPNQIYTAGSPASLLINRTLTNCSGLTTGVCANADASATASTVTRLRFRITDLTTFGVPGVHANLAAVNSTGGTYPVSGGGSVTVEGLGIDAPSNPALAGINATLDATSLLPPGGLASGQSISVAFAFDVYQGGAFRFAYNSEDDLVAPRPHTPDPPRIPGGEPPHDPGSPAATPDPQPVPDRAGGALPASPAQTSPLAKDTPAPPTKAKAPHIAARFAAGRRSTRIVRLAISRLVAPATVTLRCTGRGCPFSARHVTTRTTSLDLTRRLHRARLAPGVRLRVTVRSQRAQPADLRFTVRSAKAPRQDTMVSAAR